MTNNPTVSLFQVDSGVFERVRGAQAPRAGIISSFEQHVVEHRVLQLVPLHDVPLHDEPLYDDPLYDFLMQRYLLQGYDLKNTEIDGLSHPSQRHSASSVGSSSEYSNCSDECLWDSNFFPSDTTEDSEKDLSEGSQVVSVQGLVSPWNPECQFGQVKIPFQGMPEHELPGSQGDTCADTGYQNILTVSSSNTPPFEIESPIETNWFLHSMDTSSLQSGSSVSLEPVTPGAASEVADIFGPPTHPLSGQPPQNIPLTVGQSPSILPLPLPRSSRFVCLECSKKFASSPPLRYASLS